MGTCWRWERAGDGNLLGVRTWTSRWHLPGLPKIRIVTSILECQLMIFLLADWCTDKNRSDNFVILSPFSSARYIPTIHLHLRNLHKQNNYPAHPYSTPLPAHHYRTPLHPSPPPDLTFVSVLMLARSINSESLFLINQLVWSLWQHHEDDTSTRMKVQVQGRHQQDDRSKMIKLLRRRHQHQEDASTTHRMATLGWQH